MLELGTDAQGNQEVDQIVSIDAQNVLLVYGTDEGIRQLNEIIDFLDRPIRQVEIESQFIDISVSDAKAFGLQFYNRNSLLTNDDEDDEDEFTVPNNALGALPGAGGASTLVFTRGMFQARLQALAQSGRARIINSPRVTTMNNLTASLVSQQQTPVVLTSSDTGIGGQVGESQNAFFLTTMIGIQVTPTIQNDDTITVFLTPQVSVQSQTPTFATGGGGGDDDDDNDNPASSIPSVSSQFVTTVANVKDNDVIVLGGLRTRTQNIARSRIPILSKLPLIGRLFRSTNTTDVDRELVIFLTARILRRSDDVTPIQGP
jgi:general secretion pathway protein D